MQYFEYWTIFTLAVFGWNVGYANDDSATKTLIVKNITTLPYPEGTACAQVLIAGERWNFFTLAI